MVTFRHLSLNRTAELIKKKESKAQKRREEAAKKREKEKVKQKVVQVSSLVFTLIRVCATIKETDHRQSAAEERK